MCNFGDTIEKVASSSGDCSWLPFVRTNGCSFVCVCGRGGGSFCQDSVLSDELVKLFLHTVLMWGHM